MKLIDVETDSIRVSTISNIFNVFEGVQGEIGREGEMGSDTYHVYIA